MRKIESIYRILEKTSLPKQSLETLTTLENSTVVVQMKGG
jgi:hypothetical protein